MYRPRISLRAAKIACWLTRRSGLVSPFSASPRACCRILRSTAASGETDFHVHQEAVELGFGQRVGAFLLDRVLRGHHQKQRR
jgi:hypothetical protein